MIDEEKQEYFVEELGKIARNKIDESYNEYYKKTGKKPKYLILSVAAYKICFIEMSPNRYMGMKIAVLKNENSDWVAVG